MIHLRIIGSLWLISSLVPALKHPIELRMLATHPEYRIGSDPPGVGFWVAQLSVKVSFLLIMLIGWGLICLRRRAVAAGGFLGVISLLICAWFIVTQGTKHGPEPYVAIWRGVALSVYTLYGVWRFSVHKRIAQPGTAPNNGRATPIGNSDGREGPPSISR